MAEFYMGQVMMTGFGFAPKYFAQCSGAILPVSQNQALFSLLGTIYGGDGRVVFILPDLRGRTPAGGFLSNDPDWQPAPYAMGLIAGVETVGLNGDENPQHTHVMAASSSNGTSGALDGNQLLAATSPGTLYGAAAALVPQTSGPTSGAGAGQPHENMQPFQVINFNIALTGIYPSRG